MIGPLLLLVQAAAAAPPDIQFHATVDVRSAKVESRGRSSVHAWATPDGGSATRSSGNSASRHFELHIDARLADPSAVDINQGQQETAPQQPR